LGTTQAIDSTRRMLNYENDKGGQSESQIDHLKTEAVKVDVVDEDDRLLYLEDLDNIGEAQIIQNLQLQASNRQIVFKFGFLFIAITLSSAISCFLNYKFSYDLAVNSFIMLGFAFCGDHFGLRFFISLLLSFLRVLVLRWSKGRVIHDDI